MLPEAVGIPKMPQVALRPANANPWYALATIYGEQPEDEFDGKLHAKNRRIWNGWFCGHLSDLDRQEVAKLAKLNFAELAPLTAQERAEVEQIFAGKRMVLPSAKSLIELGHTRFSERLNMSSFVFNNTLWIENSVFDKRVSFFGSLFVNNALFKHSVFRDGALFATATFDAEAQFGMARFERDAQFGFVDFKKGAKFISANFDGFAGFTSTKFAGDAEFDSVTFIEDAGFASATFGGDADFDAARFNAAAGFDSAAFSRFAHFTGTSFAKMARFSDCQFERPTSFREARFRTQFPDLAGTILHTNTSFTAKDEFWPCTDDTPAEESRESLAIIRHAVGKQGLPEEEHYFYRREMGFAARIGTPLQRLPYRAFGALSDFGYSLAKPTIWLAAVWFVGLLAYSYLLTWLAPTLADAHPIFTAAGFSVAQLFGFLGFTNSYFRADFLDALPTALKVLAGCQTVAGVVLLFFLGLGLRNRFRLK